jgi:hypothetical protein
MKKKVPVGGVILAVLILAGSVHAQELSQEQQGELMTIGIEFAQKGALLEGMIQGKMTELALELQREGRLDSEEAAEESAKRANAILRDVGELYGQFIKTKVAFVLEAKNVLTDEQKLHLLAQLNPQETLPYDTIEYMQPDIFDLPLNLSSEQRKELIKLEADLLIKEIKLERDVELILLDLETVLMSGEPAPQAVDPLIMNLADLAAKEIDNRVSYFLEAKDVLTLDQKRLLAFLMGLD